MHKFILKFQLFIFTAIALVGCFDNSKSSNESEFGKEAHLIVGMSGNYFPYTFVKDGELQGLEVDIFNEIANQIGYSIEFKTADFSGLFGLLNTHKIDTIANQITITPERSAQYLFTTPYATDGAQIVVKKGNPNKIQVVDDLNEKSVGVTLGSNYESLLSEHRDNHAINIVTYDSNVMINDVLLGRIEAYVTDLGSAKTTIQAHDLDLELAGQPFNLIENAYPFLNNEKNKALLIKINDALQVLMENGTLERLKNKWVVSE